MEYAASLYQSVLITLGEIASHLDYNYYTKSVIY